MTTCRKPPRETTRAAVAEFRQRHWTMEVLVPERTEQHITPKREPELGVPRAMLGGSNASVTRAESAIWPLWRWIKRLAGWL